MGYIREMVGSALRRQSRNGETGTVRGVAFITSEGAHRRSKLYCWPRYWWLVCKNFHHLWSEYQEEILSKGPKAWRVAA
jgi:hypothetical protein